MASTEEALAPKVLGDKDAPVTILAFESLTCPHCASFHKETLPELKKTYIETGKAKLVFTDFPLDGRALLASMVARCTGDGRYFGMLDILFAQQASWSQIESKEGFLDALNRLARQGGLTDQEFKSCIENETLFNGIRAQQETADKQHDIRSTPTFIVGDKRLVGAQPFAEFQKVIEPMLKKP